MEFSLPDFTLQADGGHNVIPMTLSLFSQGGVTFSFDLSVESQVVPGKTLDQMILPLDLIDCLFVGCSEVRFRAAPSIIEEFMRQVEIFVPIIVDNKAFIDIEVDGTAQLSPSFLHRIVFVGPDPGDEAAGGIVSLAVTLVFVAVALIVIAASKLKRKATIQEQTNIEDEGSL